VTGVSAHRLGLLADPWRDRVARAAHWLGKRGFGGRVGLILGSGLGNVADALDGGGSVDYATIPGFRTPSVAEHSGRLVHGEAAGVPVLVMQGRLHPYEGLPHDELLLPTAVLACLGIEVAVVTNAAGGLNRFFTPGDLMVIRDQIDLHFEDPLRGLLARPLEPPSAAGLVRADRTRLAELGRSGGVTGLYDPNLARASADAAAAAGVPVHGGTYASMPGPAYEAKAEIGMLRRIGCDAVGMSTAAEVVLLHRLGVRTVGLSCITNPARETGQPELSHRDVVEVGRMVRDRIARLLLEFLPRV
jgi:purine-nucleoside phosphorylase